jgi:cell division protein FtsL
MELTGREKIYFTTFRIAVLLLISLTILAVFLNYTAYSYRRRKGDEKSLGKARTKEGSMGGATPQFLEKVE